MGWSGHFCQQTTNQDPVPTYRAAEFPGQTQLRNRPADLGVDTGPERVAIFAEHADMDHRIFQQEQHHLDRDVRGFRTAAPALFNNLIDLIGFDSPVRLHERRGNDLRELTGRQ